MAAFQSGESEAGVNLMELFSPELQRLAASPLRRERQGHAAPVRQTLVKPKRYALT